MAATGLLGVNPYYKGVNIDVSKPVNLAIQLQQKEAAKREALDKYFMDYEKSINPAGMRAQDQDVFLNKLGQAKQYYLQNRDKILNPAKYGAEFQSTYNTALREAQSLIGQSKQAAAEGLIRKKHYVSQKGLNAPDGYMEAVDASELPITRGYKPLDITQWKFYENFEPTKYANKVYSKIPLSEESPITYDIKEKPGYFYTKTTSRVSPEYKDRILQEGYNDYANDEGVRKGINEIFDTNKNEVKRLEAKYGVKIPNAQALAGIYTWDLQPIKENTSAIIAPKSTTNINVGDNKGMEGLGWVKNMKNVIQNGELKDISAEGRKLFAGGGGEYKFENMISRNLPNGVREIQIDYNKEGAEGKEYLRTDDPNIYYKLAGLYQKFTGSDVKMEKAVLGNSANLSNIDKPSKPKNITNVKYILNGRTYNIPSNEVGEFLKDNPKAKKG